MTFYCDREEFGMASISERESREIEAANASGTTPVVFIHGLWLLPSSWANWADFFKQAGYAPLTPAAAPPSVIRPCSRREAPAARRRGPRWLGARPIPGCGPGS